MTEQRAAPAGEGAVAADGIADEKDDAVQGGARDQDQGQRGGAGGRSAEAAVGTGKGKGGLGVAPGR